MKSIDEKNTFINCLSNEPFYKVKDELQNIIVECKEKCKYYNR